ncbi:MAG: CDP-2,3-bis-(O-geranylgeranyl)-sn-glycerol synthase [Haloarculaceae archaeon]
MEIVAREVAEVVAVAFWTMLPAYLPNNAAVLVGGGPPIDGGRTWRGRRLLGDGKTWRGTGGGIVAGAAVALIENALSGAAGDGFVAVLPHFPPVVVLSLPVGALAGDMTASFVKRRLGRERGAAVPGLDQLDFVVGALVLTALAAPAWFGATFSPEILVAVLVMTPVLHVVTNAAAYLLGLKQEPW